MSSPFRPIKVVNFDLADGLDSLDSLTGYETVQALVRLHCEPLGYATIRVPRLHGSEAIFNDTILESYRALIARRRLGHRLSPLSPDRDQPADQKPAGTDITVTVAVCTRDRTSDLARCLQAIRELDYPALDVLIIDNAPSNDATEQLIRSTYPDFRYVRELRPGLNWARNRAIQEAHSEVLAYTDDDVIVDSGWAKALAAIFAENPGVMAVTGLVAPFELETEAQVLFEKYGGFGRGFKRRWYTLDPISDQPAGRLYAGAGMFGTGANMAYRRSVFEQLGSFDPALDVGTVTNGGGDLEMFFRILKEGHTLVYEPRAVVFHRHRRDYAQLRTQLTNNGIGFYAYLVRTALAYPEERLSILRFGIWWLWWWNLRRLLISFKDPQRFPRDLIVAELRGSFTGLLRYQKSRRNAMKIAASPTSA